MAKHRIDLQLFAVSSEEYWRNREEENLKNNLKSEEEYDKRLKEIYQNMLDSCQSEINAFYGRYASKENISITEAKKRVSELDIKAYERKAKRYVKEKDLSKEANEEMRLYNLTMKVNRLEMLKANIGLELIAGHDELNKFMGEILKGRTKAELKRQAGILGKTITNNAQKADAIVNGSFQNATFSQRIWMYQDALRSDLDKLLQSGLIQGKNPRELAKTLRRTFDTTISNAERLMRTELARVQTEAQKQSFQRNGYSMYTYHCIGNDGKTCSTCKGLNGKHFKVEDMLPGTNASPMHPNCRCSCSAYEDSAEYEAWLDHLANGGTSEEYNKQKMQPKTKVKAAAKVSDTKDFTALSKYLEKHYNISVDDAVTKLHFESVRSALTGVESVLKETKGLLDTIKQVTTSKSGVMSCNGANITFNPEYYKDDGAKIQQACKDMSESRWWIPNATPASIGAHETAHAIEWMMLQKDAAYEYSWQRIDAWNKCAEAKKLVSQACKNVKKTEYGKGKVNAQLIGGISRYGQSNASETMAEAFADCYANGENANPLSIEIKRLTLEKIETYNKGG